MPAARGVEQSLKRWTVGPEDLYVGSLRRRQVGSDADVQDGSALLRIGIEAEWTMPARESGKQFHALDDPADDGQIPIEPPGWLADRDVEATPIARIRRVVPGNRQRPIAVDQPGLVSGRIARRGKAFREPYFGSVDIAIRKPHPRKRGCNGPGELGRQSSLRPSEGPHLALVAAVIPLRIIPLSDEVVLHPDDGQTVEVTLSDQSPDVR